MASKLAATALSPLRLIRGHGIIDFYSRLAFAPRHQPFMRE